MKVPSTVLADVDTVDPHFSFPVHFVDVQNNSVPSVRVFPGLGDRKIAMIEHAGDIHIVGSHHPWYRQ